MWKAIILAIVVLLLIDHGECWRRRRRRRRAPPPPVHGGWTGWSLSRGCSKTCGGGVQFKKRTCANPRPANGGRGCSGPSTISEACNLNRCPEPPPIYGSGIKYQRVGCYRNNRRLNEMVLTERDPTSAVWNGHFIQWGNWNKYMVEFLNRCAVKVKSKGYKVFGAINYGECWSARGVTDALKVLPSNLRDDSVCVKASYQTCRDIDARCVGKHSGSAVYKIIN